MSTESLAFSDIIDRLWQGRRRIVVSLVGALVVVLALELHPLMMVVGMAVGIMSGIGMVFLGDGAWSWLRAWYRWVEPAVSIAIALTAFFLGTMHLIVYRSFSGALVFSFAALLYLLVPVALWYTLKRRPLSRSGVALVATLIVTALIFFAVQRFRPCRLLVQAETALKNGDKKQATEKLEQALAVPGGLGQPMLAKAHFELMLLYLSGQKWQQAQQEAFKLWRLDRNHKVVALGNDPQGNLYYAFCHDQEGRYPEAAEWYLTALEQFPDNHRVHFRLAELYMMMAKLHIASAHAKEAVRLAPLSAEYHNLLGALSFYLSDFEAAAREYQLAVQLNPRDKQALSSLGNVYFFGQSDAKKTLQVGSELIRYYPDQADGYYMSARAYQMEKRYEEALLYYGRALRYSPSDDELKKAYQDLREQMRRK